MSWIFYSSNRTWFRCLVSYLKKKVLFRWYFRNINVDIFVQYHILIRWNRITFIIKMNKQVFPCQRNSFMIRSLSIIDCVCKRRLILSSLIILCNSKRIFDSRSILCGHHTSNLRWRRLKIKIHYSSLIPGSISSAFCSFINFSYSAFQ